MEKFNEKEQYMRGKYWWYYIVKYNIAIDSKDGEIIYSEDKLGFLTQHFSKESGGNYNMSFYILHTLNNETCYIFSDNFTNKRSPYKVRIIYLVVDVNDFSPKYVTRKLTQKELHNIYYNSLPITKLWKTYEYEEGTFNELIVADENRQIL